MTFEAVAPLYGGYMLSRAEGVVFLKGTIPGERVEARILQRRKDYSVAEVTKILEPSPDRVRPRCSVYGICGGCQYQHILYSRQIQLKKSVLLDCLRRIGKIDPALDATVYAREWNYRKRINLKVSDKGQIGFYRSMSHDVVEFEECLLAEPELNRVVRQLKDLGIPRGVREITLISGDITVASVKGYQMNEESITEVFKEAGVAGVMVNGRHLYGEQRICLQLKGYHYFVSPETFFQSNWSLNNTLTEMISEFVIRLKPARVIDLYAGAGNFSIPIATSVKEVIAIENNPSSCRDGQYSAEFNGITNIRFIRRNIEDYRGSRYADIAIVDPPRIGLSKKALSRILDIMPEWIVYLSCNPSTFARDLSRLTESYSIESIRMIDMFPQTYHIESLGILKRKK